MANALISLVNAAVHYTSINNSDFLSKPILFAVDEDKVFDFVPVGAVTISYTPGVIGKVQISAEKANLEAGDVPVTLKEFFECVLQEAGRFDYEDFQSELWIEEVFYDVDFDEEDERLEPGVYRDFDYVSQFELVETKDGIEFRSMPV